MFSALLVPSALPLALIFAPVQVRVDMTKLSNSFLHFNNGSHEWLYIDNFYS